MIRRWGALSAVAFMSVGMILRGGRAQSPFRGEEWVGAGTEHLALLDGEVRGSDGCNGILGTYTTEGGHLTFSLGIGTLKACLGVDTWLRAIGSADIAGDTMTVFDRRGAQIGILTRKV